MIKALTQIVILITLLLFVVSCGEKQKENKNDTTPPQIEIVNPSNGAIVNGQVTILIQVSDNVSINFTELYINNIMVKDFTDTNISYLWNPAIGENIIKVVSYDSSENSATEEITVQLDPEAPAVNIIEPQNNDILTGNVQIKVTGSDNISRVDFFIDSIPIGSDFNSAYEIEWDTTTITDGFHNLRVKGFDINGKYSESGIGIFVENNGNQPNSTNNESTNNLQNGSTNNQHNQSNVSIPSVEITSPQEGTSISGTINVNVTVESDISITKVELLLGNSIIGEKTSTPYSFTVDTSSYNGDYYLTAKAYNSNGDTGLDKIKVVLNNNTDPIGPVTPVEMDCENVSGGLTSQYNFQTLTMKKCLPRGISNPPLVVALHGFTQSPDNFEETSEWTILAGKFNFAVIYPKTDAGGRAWDWWTAGRGRDGKDPKGLKSMIDYMIAEHNINSSRVYITGLSAGAYMVVAMLADYPELFAAGGTMAGGPYGCGMGCMSGGANGDPNLVKNAYPTWWNDSSKPKPKLIIMHGDRDGIATYNNNFEELARQWIGAVDNTDSTPDVTDTFKGYPYNEYHNDSSEVMVTTISITGAGHGTYVVDPATAEDEGGKMIGQWVQNTNIYGPYYIAKFFGLINENNNTNNNTNPGDSVPDISIVSPSTGDGNLDGTVQIIVEATDDRGIEKIEFYIDDSLQHTDDLEPYEYSWNTSTITDGSHTIKVIAHDTSNQTSNDAIMVSVRDEAQDTCNEWTTPNTQHVEEGRAEIYEQWGQEYAKTVGNGDDLGLNSNWISTTVKETTPGFYEKGSCN